MKENKGFTLIETVLAITIISIAISGTLIAFNMATVYSADPMIRQQATAIGKSYIEEITSRSFPDSTPCPAPTGGGRSVYQSICDYDGLTDVGAKDQNGQAITGLEAYTVTAAIDTTTAQLGALTAGTEVVRIDVSVSHPRLAALRFSAYRTKR